MALYEPSYRVFLSSSMASDEFSTEREFLVWLFDKDPHLAYAQLYAIEMWAHGKPPSEEYKDQVLESDVMIVLLGSELRQAVRDEVQFAKEKGIPILAFRCTRHEPSNELSTFIAGELQQNVTWSEYARAFELAEKVCESLRKLVVEGFKQWQRLGPRVAREADGVLTTTESLSLKLDAARFRLSKGEVGKAKPMLEEIAAFDQENFDAHFELAYVLDNVPPYDHEKAVKHLRVATKIRPEHVATRFNLAIALIHAGEPVEAIKNFDLIEWKIDFRAHRDAAVTLGKLYLFRAEARANTKDPEERQAALEDIELGRKMLKAVGNRAARYWLEQIDDRRKDIDERLGSP